MKKKIVKILVIIVLIILCINLNDVYALDVPVGQEEIRVQNPSHLFNMLSMVNILLMLISIVLIFIATKKYKIKNIIMKCIAMYVIFIIVSYCYGIIKNSIIYYDITIISNILLLAPTIISIITVIYPIIKIKKRNNKNLKGE